jgi:hypothetical protein
MTFGGLPILDPTRKSGKVRFCAAIGGEAEMGRSSFCSSRPAATGIGTELARVFASNGHRLALVDRRGDRLTNWPAKSSALAAPSLF